MTAAKRAQFHPVQGHVHPDFLEVEQSLRHLVDNYPGGAAACVYHRGECVADLWGGLANREGAPWQRDTLATSFSTTKGVAATLLHIMADRGLIDYDQRVAHYWSTFAQGGKEDITVRQVLAHQSGLYHIRRMIDRADRMLDWDYMVRAIERSVPAHPPGTRTGYHGLTFGYLVGEIIQRVTGENFSDLVQSEIAQPLALDGLYIGAPDAALPRSARLIYPEGPHRLVRKQWGMAARRWTSGVNLALRSVGVESDIGSAFDALAPAGIADFAFDSEAAMRSAIPAANGLFTARSLAKMYALLGNGGELGGVRLLSPRTVSAASTVQPPTGRHAVIPFDMRWRLGYHGILTTRGIPRRGFGHFGFGGSGAWTDPSQQLAVALTVNSGGGGPFGDARIARISGAALKCARQRVL